MMKLFEELNTEQQKAVISEGPTIIIAGPGTGKTKTLTARITYLIKRKQIKPSEILALTFTKKAATEMKERLSSLSELPYIATFHSLAFDLLRTNNKVVKVISEYERTDILQTVYQKHIGKAPLQKDIKDLSLLITRYKNKVDDQSNHFVEMYNAALKEKSCIDYDDLLIQVEEELNKRPQTFKYILIDEFQDTNKLQYQIIKQLLMNDNLFVIGDPYQSIYGFRGAHKEIFSVLRTDFPQANEITLHSNYRSTAEILKASISLFPNEIDLQPISKQKGEVQLVTTINEFTEAGWIVNSINTKIGGTDLIKAGDIQEDDRREVCFRDFAVIYRTHAQNRVLEEKCIKSGIPFQVEGGDSIYKKIEVAFFIQVLRYLQEPSPEVIKELLLSSFIGLTQKSRITIKSLPSIKLDTVQKHLISKKDIKIISTLLFLLNGLVKKAQSRRVGEVIHALSESQFVKQYIENHEQRKYNIHFFISAMTQFESIQEIIEYVDYLQEHEFYDPTIDKVTLLTMHASKGLEFSYVYIAGFEEGIIPFIKKGEKLDKEEEKRLLFVAMTRAKKELYLLKTQKRNKKTTNTSQFESLLHNIQTVQDEAIERRQKKIEKWKEKKSQMTLF